MVAMAISPFRCPLGILVLTAFALANFCLVFDLVPKAQAIKLTSGGRSTGKTIWIPRFPNLSARLLPRLRIREDNMQQNASSFILLPQQQQQQLQEQSEAMETIKRKEGEGGPKEVVFSDYKYETKYFTQTVDHFSFERSNQRFQQRYLINDEYWDKENGGPIFMYCGNEGEIETFVSNTGFMWEIAPEFGAMVLFVEHRYYGESMPFGDIEIAFKNGSTLGYLTAEQALADFAMLVIDLKRNLTAHANPVVLFGGSYGGMLAAWMRLKYPHIAVGAIASSAPILQFEDLVPADSFNRIVSSDFKRESESCFETIKASWAVLSEMADKDGGLKEITKRFRLCRPLEDVSALKNWIEGGFGYLAMVNYPMPTSFLQPLPANPVRESCRRIDNAPRGSDVLTRVFAGISVFYNYTGQVKCFDMGGEISGLGTDGWSYQACTEMVMPFASNPNNSMFEPYDWDLAAFAKSCQETYGVSPRPNWITTQYESRDIKTVLKHFGSNIVFSNGLLDPWSGGSVLEDISSTIVAINIPDGAHHLDLRASTPYDPQTVVMQRKAEKVHVRAWLREFHSKKHGFFFGARMTFTMAGFGTIVCGLIGATVAVAVIQTAVRRRRRRRAEGDFNPETGLDRLADRLIEGEEREDESFDSSQPWRNQDV